MIELREYQKKIISTALKYNTLVVLPTGLGKTLIAFHVMQRYNRALFLAPTKPLVEQHYRNFSKDFFQDAIMATGSIRERTYETRFVFATPQTIMNDIDNIPRDHFQFIVFDEAHRAVGNYDYVGIAKHFSDARTLGLTASPGYTREKILEIINNLRIERIEYRSENDPEILEYLHIKRITNIPVEISDNYKELINTISKNASGFKTQLERILKIKLNKYNVEEASKRIEELPDNSRWKIWQDYSKFLTYSHLKELLEIQSIDAGIRYLESLKEEGSRAQSEIVDGLIAMLRSHNTSNHPKVEKLLEILRSNQHRQGIVFSQYKAQIFHLSDVLTSQNIPHDILIGKSYSRKKQMESIDRFVRGEVNVLLSSSVGEEGLDLPGADYVVFYESIPSPIRVIQRMGRTGRFRDGDVYILITKGTYDERSYRVARRRIKMMYSELDRIQDELIKKTRRNTLFDQI